MTDVANLDEPKAKRLELLLSYLESDPQNPSLKSEAIEAALEAGEPDVALRLIGADRELQSLGDQELNLLG
ncbi:hypothetical protein, partial [Sphingomonas sp.]|uniref:hypothetical protein n=1 Tax=Sphingomonas sp. TaxID=28214 RepID=UPI0025DEBF0E